MDTSMQYGSSMPQHQNKNPHYGKCKQNEIQKESESKVKLYKNVKKYKNYKKYKSTKVQKVQKISVIMHEISHCKSDQHSNWLQLEFF